jgi:RNA polymerase sigma-70 factor (ECF subfamily)
MPDDFRLVIALVDLQGFSYKEVAEIIGTPIGTVMSRLHRGRRILQRALIDYAVEAGIRQVPAEEAGNRQIPAEERSQSENITSLHKSKGVKSL